MKTQLRPAHEVFLGGGRLPDHTAHNEEVDALWAGFHAGRPPRVPMILGMNCRCVVLDPRWNPEGITFREVFEDPDMMLETQLRFSYYTSFYMPSDRRMGLPDQWSASVVVMNTYEAEWFGAERVYISGDMPDCHPFLDEENKRALFDGGLPDPFGRNAAFARDCCEIFQSYIDKGETYEGIPLKRLHPPFMGTDGPFTVACAIRGASEICLDLYEDPEYAHELLSFITEATIARIKAWRRLFKLPEVTPDAAFSFADDSIALLSPAMYREFILPYHQRLRSELGNPDKRGSIHLCGDATRHFRTIRDELNVYGFDTGFPVEHGALARELGPEVQINGGPAVGLLLDGTPAQVAAETRRILNEVMPHTRKFVLREGNNLPPRVPEANVAAMYEVAKAMPYEGEAHPS